MEETAIECIIVLSYRKMVMRFTLDDRVAALEWHRILSECVKNARNLKASRATERQVANSAFQVTGPEISVRPTVGRQRLQTR